MYKTILISTDGSDLATKGVEHGLALCKSVGASATIVTATDLWALGSISAAGAVAIEQYEDSINTGAKEILEDAGQRAKTHGVDAKLEHIPNRYAADAILDEAEKIGADLIVMASHGRRGLNKALLGSQTSEVLARSKVPVLVVR